MNIIKALFVFLIFYTAHFFSRQWQKEMDKTITLYEEVIQNDKMARLWGTLPIIPEIRRLCKLSENSVKHYYPILDYIDIVLGQKMDKIFKISLEERIHLFGEKFGTAYSENDSYDAIDFYNNVLVTIMEELDHPIDKPTRRNHAIIITDIKPTATDSIRIRAFPIEVSIGPSKEIRIAQNTITINSDLDNPIQVINPVTGTLDKIYIEKNFD